MKSFLLVACVLLTVCGLAQRPGGRGGGSAAPTITGSIEGRIVDATTGEPIEFATLLLKRLPAEQTPPRQGSPSTDERDARLRARLTERLGRAPTEEEIAQAKARMAERGRQRGALPAPSTETQVDGLVTDEQGTFKFSEVALGAYVVEISFIGYDAVRTDTIRLTGRKPDVKLDAISLGASAAMLETAVVTGEAELIENRVDKVVYNASQDVANQGGDGADVLRRVPLLSVDLDGNVQLRGSDQVQILINGRPSTMFAGSVGEALQAMPADEIEKVEVVTSPGARYQGEGTAGIINIITKRGGLKGLTGSVSASIGTRSNNLNSNISYAKGRFGVNGGAGARFSWNRPTTASTLRITDEVDYRGTPGLDGTSTLTQAAEGNSSWLGLNGRVGAFYDLNAFNSFTTSLRVRGRRRSADLFQTTTFDFPAAAEREVYTNVRDSRNPAFNVDWTTDYKRKYKGEDHELNLAVQVGSSIRENNFDLLVTTLDGDFPQRDEQVFNEGLNLEYTLQADYQRPLNPKLFLETGAQGVLRRLTSDYDYTQRPFGESVAYTSDPTRSNIFDYDQDVYAGYVSFRSTLSEKTSVITGLRYELTDIAGSRRQPEPGEQPFANDYASWLPSASVQYKMSRSSSVRLAYSRRIRRPGLRYVNPFVNSSDPSNISVGNPTLRPEVSDQLELTTNGRIGPGFVNASVFYRRTSDEIGEQRLLVGDVQVQSFLNLNNSDAYGASLFANYTLAKVIKLRGGFNTERLQLIGSGRLAGVTREVWQYGANGSLTIELPRDLVVESFGFYRAPRQNLQGEQASFSIWSIGAQKKLLEDRWRVGVRIVEPFSRAKSFPGETVGPNFVQTNDYSVLFRSFGINARYRFGSLKGNTPRERRSKINNSDVRDEGGGEF